jgi:hypothetical protein
VQLNSHTRLLLVALYASTLTFLCLSPVFLLPDIAPVDVTGVDLIAHYLLFGAEAWLLVDVLSASIRAPVLRHIASLLIAFTHGVVIEFLQPPLSGGIRMFDWWDIAADGTGIAVFTATHYWLRARAHGEDMRS